MSRYKKTRIAWKAYVEANHSYNLACFNKDMFDTMHSLGERVVNKDLQNEFDKLNIACINSKLRLSLAAHDYDMAKTLCNPFYDDLPRTAMMALEAAVLVVLTLHTIGCI